MPANSDNMTNLVALHQTGTLPAQILPAVVAAPNFSLPYAAGKYTSLSDYSGRPVVLAFYPADFSPVCGDQLALYNEILEEFVQYKACLLGISVDGPFCHQAYAKSRSLEFSLLADFEPKGEVARKYGVYHHAWGVAYRALFVINPAGIIHWSHLADMDVNPGADGILAALAEL